MTPSPFSRRHGSSALSPRLLLAILGSVALLVLASALPAFAATALGSAAVSSTSTTTSSGRSSLALPGSGSAAPLILATESPVWINVTNPGVRESPPGAFGGSMAYDPLLNETIYFGGCGASACPDNQTWAFAGGVWANLTDPRNAPPARDEATMDYDANMQGILLFGGRGASGTLGDTWLFRDGFWTNLSWVGPAPPARYAATMAFDPEPEENGSVLFGGVVTGIGASNDTWIWQGWSGWVPLSTSVVPPATSAGAMAYDPTGGYLLLYRPDIVNQTWELYAGQWWLVSPAGSVPLYDYYAGMVYDPSLAAIVMFGGLSIGGFMNDTWSFSGGTWQALYLIPSPTARAVPGFALDSSGSVPIVFGGINTTAYLADTWAYETPLVVSFAVGAASAEVSVPVTFTATVGGGTPPYAVTFDFGQNASETLTTMGPSVSATYPYSAAGTYVPSVSVRDQVGATATVGSPGIAVRAGPSVTASAHPAEADQGFAIAFSSVAGSSGSPPLTYTWDMGDGTTLTGASVSHAFGAPGAYTVQVTATDSAGATTNATVTVHVNPLPTVSIVAVNGSTTPGTPVAFVASLVGGTGPFQYSWDFGDGSTSPFAAPNHTYNTTGTYTVQVWANDSYGGGSHATFTVTVATVNAAGAGAPLWFWLALAALIALGAVAVALLVILPRLGKPPKSPSP